jgi:hypothetical protein
VWGTARQSRLDGHISCHSQLFVRDGVNTRIHFYPKPDLTIGFCGDFGPGKLCGADFEFGPRCR